MAPAKRCFNNACLRRSNDQAAVLRHDGALGSRHQGERSREARHPVLPSNALARNLKLHSI
jgi:hypothetical protein